MNNTLKTREIIAASIELFGVFLVLPIVFVKRTLTSIISATAGLITVPILFITKGIANLIHPEILDKNYKNSCPCENCKQERGAVEDGQA
jgi:hypothetical protein